MNKKQRLISKRKNIFNKRLKKPIRTWNEAKLYNSVIKAIANFCRHYKIGAMINDNKLSFVTGDKSFETKIVKTLGHQVNFTIKKNRFIS